MSKEIIANGDIETEKHKSYHCKNLILLEDEDIDILVSRFLPMKKIINTLSAKKMIIIIKLNHCT